MLSDPLAGRRQELLERVVARGETLRRQRRVKFTAIAAGSTAVIVLVVATALAQRDLDPREVAPIASGVATPSPTPAPTPSDTPVPAPAVAETPAPCRNSHEPRCGKFYWDPAPTNRELTIDVRMSPAHPVAGEKVTFTVHVRDDAKWANGFVSYGDDHYYPGVHSDCFDYPRERYGPWTPPAPGNFDRTYTYSHEYSKAGEYEASFRYSTESGCGEERYEYPYASQGTAKVRVVVSETTPSPSPSS